MGTRHDPYAIMCAFDREADVVHAWLEALEAAAACSLQLTVDGLGDELRSGDTLLDIAARHERSAVGVKGALLSVLLSIPSRPSFSGFGSLDRNSNRTRKPNRAPSAAVARHVRSAGRYFGLPKKVT